MKSLLIILCVSLLSNIAFSQEGGKTKNKGHKPYTFSENLEHRTKAQIETKTDTLTQASVTLNGLFDDGREISAEFSINLPDKKETIRGQDKIGNQFNFRYQDKDYFLRITNIQYTNLQDHQFGVASFSITESTNNK